ncbi:MAG: hypothetical protein IJZ93_06800 [Clostridia bacterium]|nr:hypothetical protein [Clostridia bacterium]
MNSFINGEINEFIDWLDTNGVVRDLTLFKDDEGTAYLIYDRDITKENNRCLYAVKLSNDYLSCTNEYARLYACYRQEAPAVVEFCFYLFT